MAAPKVKVTKTEMYYEVQYGKEVSIVVPFHRASNEKEARENADKAYKEFKANQAKQNKG
jgi:hypothetical protein